ncbi:CCA tRNA nucleotidyltransferase [Vagococcus silagei]|uniref:CCA-adding enzyme n=1 Tax=Vagococcus silagei TaxID=2508885 RepID=A0A4S3B8N3_9ENTE|nr:CCA tRNA nucleotidyltransferase [Vagococcus silagei]THB61295.1 CCA tRNA nucleotidyltransferase [Vagococcus silagei]
MKLENLPQEFTDAIPVMEKIIAAGFEAYFVGGSVRDCFLNQPIHDVDIATSAYPEEIKAIFKKTIDVGIEHGTVLVLADQGEYEITTFRTESTYQDFRRPDQVTFVRSLEEDLKRRDFTMNALAMTTEGEVIDLFDGVQSIKNHEIVAVGNPQERFFEDALRMMRALRFASQLDFDIEVKTLQAIKKHAHLLEKISVERIEIEWVKLLLGQNRAKGLALFIETACYEYCPGLKHQAQALNRFLKLPSNKISNETLAWLLLIYKLEVNNVSKWMKQWKVSNKMIQDLTAGLALLKIRLEDEWRSNMLYHANPNLIQLVEDAREFLGKDNDYLAAISLYEELPIHKIQELEVNGQVLMQHTQKKGGPWLGETLHELERQVVNGDIQNNQVDLLSKADELLGEEA